MLNAIGRAVGVTLLQPLSADTGTVGTGKDLSNAAGAFGKMEGTGLLVISAGTATNGGTIKVKFEHSDSVGAGYVTATHVNTGGGNGDGFSETTTGSFQQLQYFVDLSKTKRFIRASSVLVAGDGVDLSCVLIGFKKVG